MLVALVAVRQVLRLVNVQCRLLATAPARLGDRADKTRRAAGIVDKVRGLAGAVQFPMPRGRGVGGVEDGVLEKRGAHAGGLILAGLWLDEARWLRRV